MRTSLTALLLIATLGAPTESTAGAATLTSSLSMSITPSITPSITTVALQDLTGVQRAARKKSIELAEWADASKFYTGRNALYEIVLTYDAEHVEARKALGFKKQKGEWIEGKRREVVDDCEDGVPQAFAEMRRAALVELVAELDRAIAGVPMTPKIAALRRAELAKLLPFDDNAAVRERLGEVWDEEELRWILTETRTARETRAALAKRIEELREALPEAMPGDADVHTRTMEGLDFVSLFRTRGVNVTSTLEAEETVDLLLTSLLVRDVFQSSFPGQGAPGYPTVLYVFEPSERERFFKQHELSPAEKLEERTQSPCSWLDGRLAVSAASPELRKDVMAFQIVGYTLAEKYEVWIEDGWAQQGLCSYLAALVTGTRLSFWDIQNTDQYGKTNDDDKDWLARVPKTTGGWLREAKRLVDEGGTMGHFVRALAIPTIQMSWEDVVMSHAVAAYLYETRRDDLPRILLRMKAGESAPTAIEEQIGMTLEELRTRLVRWIDEIEPIVLVDDPAPAKKGRKAPPKKKEES